MIGLADRDPIRVSALPQAALNSVAKPGPPELNQVRQPDAAPTGHPAKPSESRGIADGSRTEQGPAEPRAPTVSYDFRTEKWAELYGKRIDETIDALRGNRRRRSDLDPLPRGQAEIADTSIVGQRRGLGPGSRSRGSPAETGAPLRPGHFRASYLPYSERAHGSASASFTIACASCAIAFT